MEAPLTRGVAQGSVLGLALFLICVNNLEQGILSKVAKIADNTKIEETVASVKHCEALHSELTKLAYWNDKWQISFNVDKRKVIHIGNNNFSFRYQMQGHELDVVKQEEDLGVIISNTRKKCDQWISAIKRNEYDVGFNLQELFL